MLHKSFRTVGNRHTADPDPVPLKSFFSLRANGDHLRFIQLLDELIRLVQLQKGEFDPLALVNIT